MKRIFFAFVVGIITTITSCGQVDPNKTIDEGKVDGNYYNSQEIGWTIEIPNSWTVTEKPNKETTEKVTKALEKTVDSRIDFRRVKNLITFQKDMFNVFKSTSEPIDLKYEGEWEEIIANNKKVIFSAYLNQGVKVDSSLTRIKKIDGLDFHSYSITLYSPEGEFILKQETFSRLINGLYFGVVISSNNDKYRDEMLNVFKNSRFD